MEKHGGQDIYQLDSLDQLVSDFSVTTNFLGSSPLGIQKLHTVIAAGYSSFYPPENEYPTGKRRVGAHRPRYPHDCARK